MSGTLGIHSGVDDRVHCVIDLFGPTDLLKMDPQTPPNAKLIRDDPSSPESRLLGAPLQTVPELAKSANPINYVSRDDPPFLIIHGTRDEIVPYGQSLLLGHSRQEAGVKTTLMPIESAGHGGPAFIGIEAIMLAFLDQKRSMIKDNSTQERGIYGQKKKPSPEK